MDWIYWGLLLLLVYFLVRIGLRAWRMVRGKKEAQELLKRKHAQLEQRRQEGVRALAALEADEQEGIAAMLKDKSALEVAALIRERKCTAVSVMIFTIKAAMHAQDLYRCLGDTVYKKALERARQLDEHLERTGEVVGELHGVPISVKDNLGLVGTDCTMGLAHRCFQEFEHSASVVEVLEEQGAIPYAKTNVPITLLLPETFNPVFGQTLNPWSKERTAGGSSGGESSLIAAGGSFLGIGTDIGGSVRIPAHFCGVVAFKPTATRTSLKHKGTTTKGVCPIPSAPGPMGRNVEDLALVCKLWFSERLWGKSPDTFPLPFNEEKYSSDGPLRIGYYENDGFFPSCVAGQRAVREAAAALKAAGHELVPVTLPSPHKLWEYYYLLSGDGFSQTLELLDVEPHEPLLNLVVSVNMIPFSLTSKLAMLADLLGHKVTANTMRNFGGKTADQLWRSNGRRLEYKDEVMTWWKQNKLDLILTPATATPALRHGVGGNLNSTCSYTFIHNLLDFPAGTVPITSVTANDLKEEPPLPKDNVLRKAAEHVQGSEGMPISVQFAGLPFQDELVLRGMRCLQKEVRWDGADERVWKEWEAAGLC